MIRTILLTAEEQQIFVLQNIWKKTHTKLWKKKVLVFPWIELDPGTFAPLELDFSGNKQSAFSK